MIDHSVSNEDGVDYFQVFYRNENYPRNNF